MIKVADPTKITIRKLTTITSKLEISGFFRQALLLRLCFGGLRLSLAITLPKSHFFLNRPDDSKKRIEHWFQPSAFHLRLGLKTNLDPLILLDKVASDRDLGHGEEEDWLRSPLFSSRKGGSIGPRSAERLLKEAFSSIRCDRVTFKSVVQCGLLHRDNHVLFPGLRGEDRDNAVAEEINSLIKKKSWFFRQTFLNKDDRSEAEQETRLRLYNLMSSNHLPKDLEKLTLDVARSVQHSFISGKKRKPETNFEHFDFVADIEAVDRVIAPSDRATLNGFVSDALSALPTREAEILQLVVVDQVPVASVARKLGISRATVHETKRRALAKLYRREKGKSKAVLANGL